MRKGHIHGRTLEGVLLRELAVREDGQGLDIVAGDFVRVAEGEHCGQQGRLMGFTLLRPEDESAGVLTEAGIEIAVPTAHLTRLPGGPCLRCAGTGTESALNARPPRRCVNCHGRGRRAA